MKKLINAPEDVVTEALRGIAAAHPGLVVDVENKVIVRADGPVQGKVGLVSGGGSGHEPLHGGFVGHGMLDAACPGEIFTSPVPDQMLQATKAVDGGAGVLHIVKNYTGDILNFEMAADLAKGEGIVVTSVVTNDDVAVQDSLYTAGRRGVGVTVLRYGFIDPTCIRSAVFSWFDMPVPLSALSYDYISMRMQAFLKRLLRRSYRQKPMAGTQLIR
jgi:dihydroxyacetone kinase-like protein